MRDTLTLGNRLKNSPWQTALYYQTLTLIVFGQHEDLLSSLCSERFPEGASASYNNKSNIKLMEREITV